MKIGIILGTRPEIIKMSPIIKYCINQNIDFVIIHTGQHYSFNMDKVFFEELDLPFAKHRLDIGSGSHGTQTACMIEKIEKVLMEEQPDVVLVEGDTNTVLAGALAASKLHIKVGHVEACLRSYATYMPEEINRRVVDHISDYLFAPTEEAKKIGMRENIPGKKIFVTGNTIVDAVLQNFQLIKKKEGILKKMNLKKKSYFLLTLHRPENVDNKDKLTSILKGLDLVCHELKTNIIYPIHPRTTKAIEKFKLKFSKDIVLIPPTSFLEFLELEQNAKLILTDSGGIQEEACILKVPCVTLRENTERPETVTVGGNIIAGTNSMKILDSCRKMIKIHKEWTNPFGDGTAAKTIVNILLNNLLNEKE